MNDGLKTKGPRFIVHRSSFMSDVYVAESGTHGLGVFAAREFAAGEVVLATDDSRAVDAEHRGEVGALRRDDCGGPRATPDARRRPRVRLKE